MFIQKEREKKIIKFNISQNWYLEVKIKDNCIKTIDNSEKNI